jgi:lipoate-protein ligase A
MQLLDLTFAEPAQNIALDEALLEATNANPNSPETLRLWQPTEPLVVIGRGSPAEREVQLAECLQQKIPVLRRPSGGAAIVTGPGCLMYAVVLSLQLRPELKSLDVAHRFVLQTLATALQPLHSDVARQGTSDLAFLQPSPDGAPTWYKFSGNSVRVKQRAVLYHGTLLYDFDLPLIGTLLGIAPRQPAYRAGRDHRAFVGNFPATEQALRTSLVSAWQATDRATAWPRDRVESILAEKYTTAEWTILDGF